MYISDTINHSMREYVFTDFIKARTKRSAQISIHLASFRNNMSSVRKTQVVL